MSDAYIDNGEIVLISDKGVDFKKEIEKIHKAKDNTKVGLYSFVFLSVVFLLNAVSQVFLNTYSSGQTFFFVVASAIMGLIVASISEELVKKNKAIEEINKEYNKSKCTLQKKVLELEKDLAKHEKEIEEIKCSQDLDFAQNFKKQERTIPKAMLKNS